MYQVWFIMGVNGLASARFDDFQQALRCALRSPPNPRSRKAGRVLARPQSMR